MSEKKLARHVTVAGVTYGPRDDVPADVLKQITNPKAFIAIDDEDADGDGEDDGESGREAGTKSGHKLATAVTIGGRTYGPKDPIPDDVAEKITNPKAWVDGVLPTRASKTTESRSDTPAAGATGSGTTPAKKAAPAAGDKRA